MGCEIEAMEKQRIERRMLAARKKQNNITDKMRNKE